MKNQFSWCRLLGKSLYLKQVFLSYAFDANRTGILRNGFVLFGLSKVIRYHSYCEHNYWYNVYASDVLGVFLYGERLHARTHAQTLTES
jgi:hypothetical protein